jgi:hypothetical protein
MTKLQILDYIWQHSSCELPEPYGVPFRVEITPELWDTTEGLAIRINAWAGHIPGASIYVNDGRVVLEMTPTLYDEFYAYKTF